MSRSVLIQLARNSIEEVFQAQRSIDKKSLLQEHPLLEQSIATKVNIYFENELRGTAQTQNPTSNLLEDIIKNAKKSAFEDPSFSPLTTREYLSCEIELFLTTPDGVISERDDPIIKNDNAMLETITRQVDNK